MSGANDTLNTLVNRFNPIMTNQDRVYNIYSSKTYSGIPTGEKTYNFWLRIENLMKFHVEKQLRAKSFPFLQPLNMYMENMTLEEKIQFEAEIHRYTTYSCYVVLHRLNCHEKYEKRYSKIIKCYIGRDMK